MSRQALVALAVVLVALPTLSTSGWDQPHSLGAPAPSDGGTHHHPLAARAGAASSLGGNWSTYLQNPGRTAANLAERTLSPANATQLAIEWKIKSNGSDFGSPTVVNGTVYAGSWDGYESAMNATTGHILWRTYLSTDPNCSWGSPMGVAGNAAVWNGTVFVGGGNDYWYALNATNGTVDWKVKVTDTTPAGGGYNWASPLLFHGFEYIGLASCIDSPLVQGRLLMVNLTGNHSIVHRFNFTPGSELGGTIWTTPGVDEATNTIWIATGNDDGVHTQPLSEAIVALNATNLSLIGSWQVPGVSGTDSDFGGGVILFHDASGRELVGAENKNGVFYALNRSNVTSNGSWKPVWNVPTTSGFSPGAFDGTTLYLGCGAGSANGTSYSGTVEAIDPANGSVEWTQGTNEQVYAGLAYANGLVAEGSGGTLEVMNASSGGILSTLSVPSGQSIEGAPSIENGQVFFESGDYSNHGTFLAAGIPLGPATLVAQPPNGSAPLNISFRGFASGGLPPYNFSWSFGDGQAAYGPAPLHAYGTMGSYNASVVIRDMRNASQTTNATVYVSAPLSASFTAIPWTGPAPHTVTFTGTAANGAGGPYRYNWSFGDGTPSVTGRVVTHTFTAAGTYSVVLTVLDRSNGTISSAVLVVVTSAFEATALATPTTGTLPLPVAFEGVGSYGMLPYQFLWSFGDGSPNATGRFANHTYLSAGTFAATLRASDALGTEHNITVPVVVSTAPPALVSSFGESNSTTGCPFPEFSTTVTATSSGGTPPYVDTWTFGDGSAVQRGPSANHTYTTDGTFAIALTTNDSAGGWTTASTEVTVHLTTCSVGTHPFPHTNPQGGLVGWQYLLLGAVAVVVLAAVVVVLWRRSRSRPPT
ncbi:MAG: PKD domain-containing protein [Candidatus Lutacidiplasmatales archaeon]